MKALAPLFALVFLFSHDVTAQTNDQQSRKDKNKIGATGTEKCLYRQTTLPQRACG
jgi:hypothetical protein